jgi:hypothetical protein
VPGRRARRRPGRSWRGYGYLQDTLASRGYVVASVNANDVNDRDGLSSDAGARARAQLLLAAIDGFRELDDGEDPHRPAPTGEVRLRDSTLDGELEGRVDEETVGLVGHSRGGEGVAHAVVHDRAAHDAAHGIDAVFALAPIDVTDPAPEGVDLATVERVELAVDRTPSGSVQVADLALAR